MSINYNYQVINVDVSARCMEIVYTAEGHPTQHIGARLPYENESLENVVRMFAPVAFWLELQQNTNPPSVGTSGEIRAADEAAAQAEAARVAALEPQPTTQGSQTL